jgi:hypothetical protein
VDEELANRCIVLSVDEGRAQTKAIHVRQRVRQTLEGMLEAGERERILRLHQNAQRLLQAVRIVNPYATEMTFSDHSTRTRRDHPKLLNMIRAVALLHQHQREKKSATIEDKTVVYIEATRADIALAERLMGEVLRRSLDDLPPQTRRVLGLAEVFVAERATQLGLSRADVRFTRRELRESAHLGHTQMKLHLARLVDGEFIARHRTLHPTGGQAVTYELLTVPMGDGNGPSTL